MPLRSRHRYAIIAVAAIIAAALAFILLQCRSRTAARIAAREAEYRSLGIYAPGTADFVPLPPETPHRTSAAALGNALFADKRLAKSSKRMCAACHPPFMGGADDRLHSGLLTRSAQNAAFSTCYLHDGRLTNPAKVVEYMISAPTLGAFSVTGAVERLRRDAAIVKRFEAIYATGLTASNLVDALVQRLRARVPQQSPFDRHLAGRKDALNEEQLRGFAAFKAAKCAKCHSGPALGGRAVADGLKVPALRGIARRRLFMHDGSAHDLPAAIDRMPAARGLSSSETSALLSFLKIL